MANMESLDTTKTELLKPSVLKEGHLLKLGRSMLKLEIPKLNYYVLRPSGVYCFTGKQESDKLCGFIPLDEISLSLGTVAAATSHLHCIKIADKKKVHILACHSIEIRDSWITAILTAVAQRLVYEPNFARNRMGSSSDSEVFYVTSPFWTSHDGNKRRSKWSRMSVSENVTKIKNRKKTCRSKSLEDIHSIYSGVQPNPPLARKRSMHDITRLLFWPSSSKPSTDTDLQDMVSKTRPTPNKASGKKRWSLFNITSFGVPHWDNGGKQNLDTKHEIFYEQGSPLISDTKL